MGEYYVGSSEYLQAFFNEVFVERYWKLLSQRQLITDDWNTFSDKVHPIIMHDDVIYE